MTRPVRSVLFVLAALPLFIGACPAAAQDAPEPLVVGAERALMIRTTDLLNGREMSIQDRIDLAQDIFPKHLGSRFGRITTRTWGPRVHFYLNGDFFLAATPADARVNGYKSAAALARVWLPALQRAFNLTTAQK
jgi:hypothetical protein